MRASAITAAQRHTRSNHCQVCGGYDTMPRRKGERCYGFDSEDGRYIHCTREEHGGRLWRDGTYVHIVGQSCECGSVHGNALAAVLPPTHRRHTSPAAAPRPIRPQPAPNVIEEARQEAPRNLVRAKAPSNVYDYHDAAGALLFQVSRWRMVDADTGEITQEKTFTQRRPDPARRGRWIGDMAGIGRVLYRLPALLAADTAEVVYVGEGEKCADALAGVGLLGISASGGAGNWRHTADSARATLAGRHVVILPDRDPGKPGKPHESYKGQRHAVEAANSLLGAAASVRVLMLPGLDAKGDVADWLEAGHTGEELAALALAAPAWAPELAPSIVPDWGLLPGEEGPAAPDSGASGEASASRARNTSPTQRPRRPRVPLLPATPECNGRMVWLEVNDYFTDDSRTYLYTYHERKQEEAETGASGAGEEGEAQEGEEGEEGERPGYYSAVNSWGMPRLVSIYRVDMGGERLRDEVVYQIEWSTQPDAGVHDVTGEKLADGSCWALWPGLPISTRRARDLYADIVKAQLLAFALPVIEGRTATGLHQDSRTGEWVYLLQDGRCVGEAGACASLPLHGYALPRRRALAFAEGMPALPVPAPSLDRVRGLLAFYARVSPNGHLSITVGAALRSLVSSIVPPATALLAEGPAGSGKTSNNAHSRGVVAPSPFHSEADAQFNATATYVEQTLAPLRDVPAVIDNFRIKPTDTAADIRAIADILDRVIIAAESGNAMRGRGGRTGKPQKGNHVETLPLINGEALPPALVSTLRRVMHLPYVKGVDVDVDAMEAEEAGYQPVLTGIGHSVLRYILAALNHDAGELRGRIERQEATYTRRLMAAIRETPPDGEVYRSIPENWARVLTGWWLAEVALGLVAADGAGEGEEAGADAELVAAVYPHVVRWMLAQMRIAADGGPSHITAEWVWPATLAAFEGGMMHALDRDGVPLAQTGLTGVLSDWGYVRTALGEWQTRGKYGAILDEGAGLLYIKTRVWEAALAEIAGKQARERGQGPQWTLNVQTFAGAMMRLGVTAPSGNKAQPATHVLKVAGKPDRFAAVRLADLLGDTEVSPIGGIENSSNSSNSSNDAPPGRNSSDMERVTAVAAPIPEAVTAVTPSGAAIDAQERPQADASADAWEPPDDDTGWPDESTAPDADAWELPDMDGPGDSGDTGRRRERGQI